MGALADVTPDDRFSGGALAWLAPEDARPLVAQAVAEVGEDSVTSPRLRVMPPAAEPG